MFALVAGSFVFLFFSDRAKEINKLVSDFASLSNGKLGNSFNTICKVQLHFCLDKTVVKYYTGT